MLRVIGDTLAEDGHDVHVLSSLPSYRDGAVEQGVPRVEQLGDLTVRRVWVFAREKSSLLRRLANVLIYCSALFYHVLRVRPDVITASTFPPVIAAWTSSLAARMIGADFVYHIQDIHPELSIYSGGRLGRGLPSRILRGLDNQTLRRSAKIVTLSTDMVDTLRARGLGELPVQIINNPPLNADVDRVRPPPELRKPKGTRRVIFAGNLGLFQNLPLLAEGVARCLPEQPELELMFLGDGAALPELNQKWGKHPQVRFVPFLPFSQARHLIAEADIGLVSLSPNIYRVAFPSKIATYRDLGLKVLALVEPESQLARDLQQSGGGAVHNDATPEAISDALQKLLSEPPSNTATAKPFSSQHDAWRDIMESLEVVDR
ncbi:MAG: glycosyltransferase family 4 protein [Gammaproteobacteria bacterium]|nr:glycosyltransferase family 4 protein [Gammaproteobacteria bacterium]